MLLLAVACGAIAAFAAEDFLQLWLGSADPGGSMAALGSQLFRGLLVGGLLAASRSIGRQVLLGTQRGKDLAPLFASEALANLLLSILLIFWLGLIGVVIGTLIPALVFQALIHPIVIGRIMRISLATYLAEVCVRPVLAGAALCWLLSGIRLAGAPTN